MREKAATRSGNGVQASYKYDANGMRTSKTVNGVKSQYQYVDGKLYYEKRGENEMYFTYDSYGNLSMIHLYRDGEVYTYYAVCNSRGDVKQLYTGNGNPRVEYKYDAWGNTVSVTNGDLVEITDSNDIGNLNPIRYRGYYWDSETNLYYLQSRYYDPTTMRFINADGYFSTGQGTNSHNMFAYCGNNPVMYSDPTGEFIGALVGGLIGGITGFITGGISAALNGEDIAAGMLSGALGGMAGGAVSGAIVEAFVSPATSVGSAFLIGAGSGALGSLVSNTVEQPSNYYLNHGTINGFTMDWKNTAISVFTGAVFNAAGTGFSQAISIPANPALESFYKAVASDYFTIGNFMADNTNVMINSLISQIRDGIMGRRKNPYNLSAKEILILRLRQAELNG